MKSGYSVSYNSSKFTLASSSWSNMLLISAVDLKVTQRSFNFGKKQGLPFYFVSAADGTNVVKVCS